MRAPSQTGAPANRALSTGEVQGHLRLDNPDELPRIMSVLVPAAEQWAESATGRQLVNATWKVYLRDFPSSGCPIVLPHPPLQSVTAIKYYDGDGVQQTWASTNYTVDAPAGPTAAAGRIIPKVDIAYPATYGEPYDVEIEYVAGYGANSESVPGLLKQGLLVLVGELFERREAAIAGTIINEVPLSARALILPFLWEPL